MKAWVWTSAILVAGLTIASCGGGDDGGNPNNPGGTGNMTITILGQNGNNSFSPNPAEAAGRSVVFKNNDSVTHRVVLNGDPSTDTGDIAPGATSRAIVMPAAGANYHCSLHTNMGGSVNQAGSPPPACSDPIYCY